MQAFAELAACIVSTACCMGLHELPLFADLLHACSQFCYGVLLSFILAAL